MKQPLVWIAGASIVAMFTACQQPHPAPTPTPVDANANANANAEAAPAVAGKLTNAAKGKKVTAKGPPNEEYPADGLASLVDGEMGSDDYLDTKWMGWWYEDKPFEVTIDLGESKAIAELRGHQHLDRLSL